MVLGRDFGRQQGRPPAASIPAPLSLSPHPHAVMRGSLLSEPFLSFFAFDFGLKNALVLDCQHHCLLSCWSFFHALSPAHTCILTAGPTQLFWYESGHTAVLSVSGLPVKVPPLSSLTDQVCEGSTLDLILTLCGVVERTVGLQWAIVQRKPFSLSQTCIIETSSTNRRRGGYFYQLGFGARSYRLKCDFVHNTFFFKSSQKQSGHVQPAGEVREKSHIVMPEQTEKTCWMDLWVWREGPESGQWGWETSLFSCAVFSWPESSGSSVGRTEDHLHGSVAEVNPKWGMLRWIDESFTKFYSEFIFCSISSYL